MKAMLAILAVLVVLASTPAAAQDADGANEGQQVIEPAATAPDDQPAANVEPENEAPQPVEPSAESSEEPGAAGPPAEGAAEDEAAAPTEPTAPDASENMGEPMVEPAAPEGERAQGGPPAGETDNGKPAEGGQSAAGTPAIEPLPPPPANSPNPLAKLSLDQLTATRSLPLFTPSRAPPPPPPVEPPPAVAEAEPEPVEEAPAAPTPPPVQLIGIVMAQSQQVALLADQASGSVLRYRSGDEYDGWVMSIIDSRTVEFELGDERRVLKMFAEFGGQPAGSSTPSSDGGQTPTDESITGEEPIYDENGNPIPRNGQPPPQTNLAHPQMQQKLPFHQPEPQPGSNE